MRAVHSRGASGRHRPPRRQHRRRGARWSPRPTSRGPRSAPPRPRGSTAAWCCEMASRTSPDNVTRFVWIAPEGTEPTGEGPWRTTLVFSELGADHPGALVEALTEFSSRDVNLTRIESRPLRQGLGRYMFFCDLEGRERRPLGRRGNRGAPRQGRVSPNPGQLSDRGERRAWDLRPAATALGPGTGLDLCLQSWRYGQGGGRPSCRASERRYSGARGHCPRQRTRPPERPITGTRESEAASSSSTRATSPSTSATSGAPPCSSSRTARRSSSAARAPSTRSASTFERPCVIRLVRYVRVPRDVHRRKITRKAVLARDAWTCQYCGRQAAAGLTVDHVIPRSRGGQSVWENIVASCAPCNRKKGNLTPREARMHPRSSPRPPGPTVFIQLASPRIPVAWEPYLVAA